MTMRHDTRGSVAAQPPTVPITDMGPFEVATVGTGL